ncbi:MAG: HAD-IIIC family phosphatase [bacterium]
MNLNNNMDGVEFSTVVSTVRELDNEPPPDAAPFKIAFLRNITLDPLVPYLKYLCYQAGLKPDVYMADFDVIMPEAMNPDSGLCKEKRDLIVVAVRLEGLSEALSKRFASLSDSEVTEAADQAVKFMEGVIGSLRKNSRATILVHSFETPAYPAFGIIDTQSGGRQAGTIRKINSRLADLAERAGNCFLVDLNTVMARLGYDNFSDKRMWQIAKMPYTRAALKEIAVEYAKFIRAVRGKNKKCLVLDCDNILWGGIVGEDGLENIKLGSTYPGSCYRDFQSVILNFYHRGVILAICSKNNENDVLEVLDSHPETVLRRKHFASMRINWQDKATNIRVIAEELNIGADSLVFVDDSEMEIGLVNAMLPEVHTLLLSGDASGYADLLAGCGLFDTVVRSEEDRRRGEMYGAEAERKKFRSSTGDIAQYLSSLEMKIKIARADDYSMPRIVQLIQRTNQFNLTTKRHSESEIARFAGSANHDVLFLQYSDRFGDMGIVGVAIMEHGDEVTDMDSFLLSCRVLGRKVEDAFLAECLRACENRGRKAVSGTYIPTAKNAQVADFYEKRGFTKKEERGDATIFEVDLTKGFFTPPDIFKTVEVDI